MPKKNGTMKMMIGGMGGVLVLVLSILTPIIYSQQATVNNNHMDDINDLRKRDIDHDTSISNVENAVGRLEVKVDEMDKSFKEKQFTQREMLKELLRMNGASQTKIMEIESRRDTTRDSLFIDPATVEPVRQR